MPETNSDPRIWRKKPKQGRSACTVDSLLQAAEALFLSKGFHSTSSEDIAARAGTGIGSLYDYFPNKTAVALALLENVSLRVAEDSRGFFMEYGRDPIEISLPKVVRGLYEHYRQHKNIFITLVNEVPELRSAGELYSIDRLVHRASLLYLQIYADRFNGRPVEAMHDFLNLLFAATVKQYLSSPQRIPEEEFLDNLTRVILAYIKAVPPVQTA